MRDSLRDVAFVVHDIQHTVPRMPMSPMPVRVVNRPDLAQMRIQNLRSAAFAATLVEPRRHEVEPLSGHARSCAVS